MEKLCVIFGAGDVHSPRKHFAADDLIIAADGGYAKALSFGLQPSVVIGDFDSGEMPQNTAAHIIKLNRDKDDTDMIAAVKLGLRRGYKTFVLYGGSGGRPDHTFANISTLAYLNAYDARGFLVYKDCVATVITDGDITLPKTTRGTVSVFAYGGEASGVTYKNLSYILTDVKLTPDFPLGVSNTTTDKPANICVKHGSLLIYFPR